MYPPTAMDLVACARDVRNHPQQAATRARDRRPGAPITRHARAVHRLLPAMLLLTACSSSSSNDQAQHLDAGQLPPGSDARTDGGPMPGGGSSCVPKTCEQQSADCGSLSDGCGGQLDCGTCSFSRCMANRCTASPEMVVSLGHVFDQRADGTSRMFAFQYQSCFYRSIATNSAPPGATTIGPCSFTAQTAPPVDLMLFAGDAGTVTVRGAVIDPITMSAASRSSTSLCYGSNVPSSTTRLFADGAALPVSSTGGSDFPAFSTQITAPPLVQVLTGSIVRGATLPVQWTGSEPGHTVFINVGVFYSTGFGSIVCNVDDTGAYTIPAELTRLFQSSAAQAAIIEVGRTHTAHLEPASPPVAIEVQALVYGERDVTYTP